MTPNREPRRDRARRAFVALAVAVPSLLSMPALETLAQPPGLERRERGFDLSFPHRPDELLVALTPAPRDPRSAKELELRRSAVYRRLDMRELAYLPRIRVALLQIPPPGGDDELTRVAAELAAHRELFEYVDPNRLVYLEQQGTPDPRLPDQWALPKIEAPQAWSTTKGDAKVVVAVIDSGIASDPDLDARLWSNPCEGAVADGVDNACAGGTGNGFVDDLHGWSFVGTGSPNLADEFDHGTQVAGVIGAIHDNGVCIKGVAGLVSLMPLKVSGADGHGDVGRIVAALAYAVDASADLVNASWSTDWDASLLKALQDAGAAGILVVAAAGRGELAPSDLDVDASYPCSYGLATVLCVAATTQGDGLEDGSSWGKSTVQLGAPGEAIYSTARAGACNTRSGTSLAVPHVVGVGALILAKCKGATPGELRSRLLRGDAAIALQAKTSSGNRLNARRALRGLCRPRIIRWLAGRVPG